jgi:hypothetical protein
LWWILRIFEQCAVADADFDRVECPKNRSRDYTVLDPKRWFMGIATSLALLAMTIRPGTVSGFLAGAGWRGG